LTASTKTLERFKQVDGNIITQFSSYLNAIVTSDYEPNKKVDERLKNFIDKYEKLAVQVQ
jgi:DNA-binding ferritin-like protein